MGSKPRAQLVLHTTRLCRAQRIRMSCQTHLLQRAQYCASIQFNVTDFLSAVQRAVWLTGMQMRSHTAQGPCMLSSVRHSTRRPDPFLLADIRLHLEI